MDADFEEGGVEGGVEALDHLGDGVGVGRGGLAADNSVAGAVGMLADAGADNDLEEELELVEAEVVVAHDNVAAEVRGELPIVGWLEANVVNEVTTIVLHLIQGFQQEEENAEQESY